MRNRYRAGRGKRNLSGRLQLVLALLLAGLALTAVTRRYRSKPQEPSREGPGNKGSWTPTWLWGAEPKQEQWPETLVVYIFSNTDPEYFNNLKFFLKWGVREGDGAYYIIVVQEGGKSPVSPHLALTPVNLVVALALKDECCVPNNAGASKVSGNFSIVYDNANGWRVCGLCSAREYPAKTPEDLGQNVGARAIFGCFKMPKDVNANRENMFIRPFSFWRPDL